MKLKIALAALVPVLLVACGQASDPTPAESTEAAAVDVVVPSGDYTLDKNRASLIWSIPHMGVASYVASFTDIDAQLSLNVEDLSKSAVVLTINPLSVDANYPGDYAGRTTSSYKSWSEEIGSSPGFLDGVNSGTVTFTSTKVEQTGPTTAKVTGDLQFRGQIHPVTMMQRFLASLPSILSAACRSWDFRPAVASSLPNSG